MKYLRIFTGIDGESYFEDVEIPMSSSTSAPKVSPDMSIKRSEITKASGISFCEFPAGIDFGWHTAPRRQFVICLQGEAEFTTSQGIKRRVRGGDLLLAEDTKGKGHQSKIVGQEVAKVIYVPLE